MSDQSPREIFEEITKRVNESPEAQRIIEQWVGPYDGKILQFETDAEKFHLVIADGRMELCTGEYPSPDLILRGSSQVITDVFTGRRSVGEVIRSWDLLLMGAGHEGFMLGRLIATVSLET